MHKDKLVLAMALAQTFINRGKEVCAEIKELEKTGKGSYPPSGKLTGAVKRVSMDLTRALADVRRCGS